MTRRLTKVQIFETFLFSSLSCVTLKKVFVSTKSNV